MMPRAKRSLPWLLLATVAALALLAVDGAGAPSGGVRGVVVVVDEEGDPVKDRSGVVVSLEGGADAKPVTSDAVYEIHQRDKQFYPRQLVVLRGSTIEFPNDDRIDHNVFSLSRVLRFDLGLYRSGASKKVVAKRPGVVDVFCNIHSEMSAKILVLDTPYHAVTDKGGRYEIRGAPPGRYTLKVWHARGIAQETEVVVRGGVVIEQPWRVVLTDASKRHLRKNGTPYGRYQ